MGLPLLHPKTIIYIFYYRTDEVKIQFSSKGATLEFIEFLEN